MDLCGSSPALRQPHIPCMGAFYKLLSYSPLLKYRQDMLFAQNKIVYYQNLLVFKGIFLCSEISTEQLYWDSANEQ